MKGFKIILSIRNSNEVSNLKSHRLMKTRQFIGFHVVVITTISVLLSASCKKDDSNTTVTDIDGNTYKTITIGKKVWMAENLKTTKFRDGSAIELVSDKNQWEVLTTAACCWYDNSNSNKITFGGLYNGYAVKDSRGLCPAGWHVATDDEWINIELSQGLLQAESYNLGDRGVTENVGGHLKSTSTWDSPNSGADNKSGFSALGSGYRRETGDFEWIGQWAGFYASTGPDADHLYRRYLGYDYKGTSRSSYILNYGYSIRCVKD
jgi:uncharacterized protein (TIGR02145 family)